MKLNRKGYTLIELLAVVVVIGLVIGLSTYGVITAYNNSKGKATIISESSIKKSASVFSEEKANDSDRWIDISSGKYFCTTIEELMNNGLLDKKAKLEGNNVKKYSYIVIKKNKVTLVNSDPRLLISDNSEEEEYKVCTGNIKNEEIKIYPSLDTGTSYTDEIRTPFTDGEAESSITDRKCLYGDTSGSINKEGKVVNNECVFDNLKDDTDYYIRVCMETEKNSTMCSNTESRTTKKIKDPIITINNNVNIEYKNDGINGEAGYYFNSTIKGTSNKDVQECTLSNNIFTCQDGNTKEIKGFTWYKTLDNNINITHTENGNGKITARTLDKSNNMAEAVKEISVYKIIFKKGTADTIGGVATDIEKLCTAEKSKTCSVTSPSVEKNGYEIIGWNTSNRATTSSWNVNTSKSISANSTYYPITKLNTYTVSYNANGGSGTPSNQTKPQGTNLVLSSTKPTRSGYTFVNWNTKGDGTGKSYAPGATYSTDANLTLYAIWKTNASGGPVTKKYTIKFDANGGTGTTKEVVCDYGSKCTLTGNAFTRDGYEFTGWNTKSDGNGVSYRDGAVVKDLSSVDGSIVTLYAKWKANDVDVEEHVITFIHNDGTNRITVLAVDDNDTIPFIIPDRDGYEFAGWYTDVDLTKKYDFTTKVKGDITLYAKWTEDGYSSDKTDEEISNNSKTGDVMMFIVWTVGIGTLAYSVYYFKTRKEN